MAAALNYSTTVNTSLPEIEDWPPDFVDATGAKTLGLCFVALVVLFIGLCIFMDVTYCMKKILAKIGCKQKAGTGEKNKKSTMKQMFMKGGEFAEKIKRNSTVKKPLKVIQKTQSKMTMLSHSGSMYQELDEVKPGKSVSTIYDSNVIIDLEMDALMVQNHDDTCRRCGINQNGEDDPPPPYEHLQASRH